MKVHLPKNIILLRFMRLSRFSILSLFLISSLLTVNRSEGAAPLIEAKETLPRPSLVRAFRPGLITLPTKTTINATQQKPFLRKSETKSETKPETKTGAKQGTILPIQNKSLPLSPQKRNPAGISTVASQSGQFQLLPEIGFTTMNYSETGILPYSAILVTGKLNVHFTLIPKKLYLYSDALYSGLSQFANTPSIGAAMIWLNAGVSYTLNFNPWHFGIRTGWYYGTMLVKDSQFGINGLYGLSATPFITRDFGPNTNVGGSFKYAPALGTSRLSDTANALGLFWAQTLNNSRIVQINLDYSFTNLVIDKSTVNLTTISLNFSYSGFFLNF